MADAKADLRPGSLARSRPRLNLVVLPLHEETRRLDRRVLDVCFSEGLVFVAAFAFGQILDAVDQRPGAVTEAIFVVFVDRRGYRNAAASSTALISLARLFRSFGDIADFLEVAGVNLSVSVTERLA